MALLLDYRSLFCQQRCGWLAPPETISNCGICNSSGKPFDSHDAYLANLFNGNLVKFHCRSLRSVGSCTINFDYGSFRNKNLDDLHTLWDRDLCYFPGIYAWTWTLDLVAWMGIGVISMSKKVALLPFG
mgnify:CR=1 FL=1